MSAQLHPLRIALHTPPRRPPGVDEEEAWAAGLCREAGCVPGLRVVTWNVWFDDRQQDERLSLLLKELAAINADVVGLQEITEETAFKLRRLGGLAERYAVSPNEISGYGCLLLVRHSLEPAFSELMLKTTMGRTAVVARLASGAAVATVHLESLDSERTRRTQLETIAAHLEPFDHALIFGDFNFDDRRTWGEWRNPRLQRAVLENSVLGEVLPRYVDAWPALKGDELGYTMDGSVSPFMRDRRELVRYDRVMVAGLRPVAVEVLEGRAAGGLFCSDHYGVRVDVALGDERPTQ